MKKFVSLLILTGLVLPLFAQVDHDYDPNDRVALVNSTITKEQVPAAVLKAVNKHFDKSNPLTWSKFPYTLKEYGWVYDVNSTETPLNHYEVTMKTSKGNELWAVYSADGQLIQTRELYTDAALPEAIQQKLANSPYKDWTVVGDKEIVKFYHDNTMSSVDQHFRITVEKNNVRRSISFNDQASTKS